jgi:hypothetical protein
MANQTFASILDRPSREAAPPPVIPQGSYVATVNGFPRRDKSSKKQTEFVEFTLTLVQPLTNDRGDPKDVNAEELKAIGGVSGKQIRDTYYLTDAAEYRLTKFLDDCNLPDEDEAGEALTHRERIDLINGNQIGVFIKHTPSDDGTRIFANVNSTFALEE